jgi:coenzyme F420-0:L-glutamate ligase/coenzyme F420-1:gamma-L-glutamate ligase
LHGIPEVTEGADLAALLLAALARARLALTDGDLLAVSSKVASKMLGLTASPADKAAVVASQTLAVVAERESGGRVSRVVRSLAGPVMAAAGVDASNTGGRDVLLLLPHDPDAVCRALHVRLTEVTGVAGFGVLLTDTVGRPWRAGQTDIAIGSHGLRVLDDLRGSVDADGRPLTVTLRAIADEVAAAADLVKGKATGVPAVLVRGLAQYVGRGGSPGARSLVRGGDGDWFALGAQEAVRAALGVAPGSVRAEQVGVRPVAGDTDAAKRTRAAAVALDDAVGPWAYGVALAQASDGPITVSGADPFAVGLVTARLLVALAGEGLPYRVVRRAGQAVVLRPGLRTDPP